MLSIIAPPTSLLDDVMKSSLFNLFLVFCFKLCAAVAL